MPASISDSAYVRLSGSLFRRLETQGWPRRAAFVTYFHRRKYPGDAYRGFASMKRGEAVPEAVAHCLLEYLREKDKWGWTDLTIDQSLEPAVEPSPERSLWLEWQAIADAAKCAIATGFADRKEMYVDDAQAWVPAVAEIIVKFIGRENARPDEPADDASCLARGESIMARSVAEFARWLAKVLDKEHRSIMFAVCPEPRKHGSVQYQRATVSLMLPLTKSAFDRFCAGGISDLDLSPADIECPSQYLFHGGFAWPVSAATISARDREAAEVYSLMYQIAYLSHTASRPWRPAFCAIGATPLFEARLERLGYRATGTCVRGSTKPIMVMRHPAELRPKGSVVDWFNYKLMLVTFRAFQIENRHRWNRERLSRR